ncbi:MAG: nickel insertion protein, partial [Synergistota bacterium]|nr:nickel insertion protein [Synergistota bacterium]
MILIDPQCGVSPLSLVGALAGLKVKNMSGADVLPDRLDLPGGSVRRIRCAATRDPSSGAVVNVDYEQEKGENPFSLTPSAICDLLAEQWPSPKEVVDSTAVLLTEMKAMNLSGGGNGDRLPDEAGAALAAFAFLRMTNYLAGPVLSLPVGVGGGSEICGDATSPLPHPNVVAIAAKKGVPLRRLPLERRVTDASALLMLSHVADFAHNLPSFVPEDQSSGSTKGETTVRAISIMNGQMEEVWIVEAALDDATGEELGRALEILQEVSLEAHIVQALGKKGRPLSLLRTLARTEQLDKVFDRYFRDTPTIGLRYWPVGRTKMERSVSKGELVVEGRRLPARVKIS